MALFKRLKKNVLFLGFLVDFFKGGSYVSAMSNHHHHQNIMRNKTKFKRLDRFETDPRVVEILREDLSEGDINRMPGERVTLTLVAQLADGWVNPLTGGEHIYAETVADLIRMIDYAERIPLRNQ